MFDSHRTKEWLRIARAHVCTLAVAASLNSTWRVPRDAFRYGGLAYGLVHTVAMVTVALPVTLLQLAVGQLCQQDTVGMWRAAPFFKGVGYMRLLTSLLGSVYTVIYAAVTVTYFLYTVSNPIPLWGCTDIQVTPDELPSEVYNSSLCLNLTFLEPVAEQPEYYLALALIIAVLWITSPFVLYNPVKFMKKLFYVITPFVLILGIVIVSCIGDTTDILSFEMSSDWRNFLEPQIWHGALIQALWSSQIAGGYLVSAGDAIYANTNVQWSASAIIAINIVCSWAGSLFWFGIGGSGEKDTSAIAVVVQIYNVTVEKSLNSVWPLLLLAFLFFSGFITMLCLLYPLYERFRHIGGHRWRIISVAHSTAGCALSLAVLAGRLPALALLEDIAVPFLITVTTVLEISAFIFVYGWKTLVEDVEFLCGRELSKYWVWGWCAAPGVIVPVAVWWVVTVILNDGDWTQQPWDASTLVATAILAFTILLTFAVVAVTRQVQYDFLAKLKSSFKPSRHWGPRDPITHYYWLARREEADRGNLPRSVYHRRQLGQLSGRLSFLNPPTASEATKLPADIKQRANSDDWLYTVYRRKYLEKAYHEYLSESRRRCKSLDLIPGSVIRCGQLERSSAAESAGSIKEEDKSGSNVKGVAFVSTN